MKKVSRPWRTVRVFISSTFKDMHAERDHLVKVVFPALREQLQAYRVHLVDIDLRWGVTQEQADSGLATDLCLQQVDDCRPFLVGILGARYGSVPKRPRGPTVSKYRRLLDFTGRSVTELETMASLLGDPGRRLRALFFFRDPAFIDEVPAAKRAEVAAENPDAERRASRLKEAIRSAPLAVPPMEGYPCSYRGLRVSPWLVGRELDPGAREAFEKVAQDGLVDAEEYERLDGPLRDFVHCHGAVYVGGLEPFGQRVQQCLWRAIRSELELPDAPPAEAARGDTLSEEEELHERFMESRLQLYVERERIQSRLLEHVRSEDPRPLLVTGPPGSGKSALMARLVQELEGPAGADPESNSGARTLVIPHFVGASPGSTSLRQMLRRFCLLLRREAASTGEVKPGEHTQGGPVPGSPELTDELIREFQQLIQQIPEHDRVVLVIDALNQLDAADNAYAMHWLPRRLPANLRVVVSCVAAPETRAEAGGQGPAPSPGAPQVLAAFRHRPHRDVEVSALTKRERLAIVREVPSLSAKTLDQEQISLLLQNPATRNPLFLLVALEELRGFGSFGELDARIARFPREGDTLTEVFQQVMERLEQEFGVELVRSSLSSLACSRYGLSERELAEMTVGADRPGFQSGTGAGGLYAVLRQIRPYTQYRGESLDFFHRNLAQAVRQRYLGTPEAWHNGNAGLAAYFRRKADPEGDGSWSGGYPRGLRELPYHLVQADDGESLGQVLTDLGFLQAKVLEFGPQALIEDFHLSLDGGVNISREVASTLGLLRDALRLSVHQLASDPAQLLSQLWARLMYEEAPSVKALLQSFAATTATPWLRLWTPSLTGPGPLLWEADVGRTTPQHGRPKVSLTPDADKVIVASGDGRLSVFSRDSAVPLIELEGDASAGPVLDAVVTDEGRKVTVLRAGGSVDVWNVGDQALESTQQRVEPSSLQGTAHALASDGDLVMIGTESGSVELRRLGDPSFRQRLEGHQAEVRAVALAPAAHRAAAAYTDGALGMWDTHDGRGIPPGPSPGGGALTIGKENWEDYGGFGESPPNALAIAGSGETLFVGNAEKIFSNVEYSAFATEDIRGVLSQWDLSKGTELFTLEAYPDSPVHDLDVTPDGRFEVTLSERGILRLWDLTKSGKALGLAEHNESDPVVAVTPDRSRVLSVADDGVMLVQELATGRTDRWRGQRDPAFDLRVSPDSRYAIVVSAGCCIVWGAGPGAASSILGDLPHSPDRIPEVWIRCVVPLTRRDRALTVTGGGAITTWNLVTGEPEREPVGLPEQTVRVAAAAPAGRWLLYAPDDCSLVIWDLERGVPHGQFRFEAAGSEVTQLFPVSDEGHFYIQLRDGSSYLWDPGQAAPQPAPGSRRWGACRAMTPDGNYALFGRESTLSLVSLRTDSQLAAFTAEAGLCSFALSQDGHVVAASDRARRVHILFLEVPEGKRHCV